MTPEGFDRSKYRVQGSQSTPLAVEENTVPFDRSKYLTKAPGKIEGFLKETGRHIARTASRVGETIAGLPGDFVSTLETVSQKLPKPPESLQREPNFVQEYGKKLLKELPTSEDIKKKSIEFTESYTAPQTESEQFADEIASLTGSLAIPTKDPFKAGNLLRSIGLALGATSAKEGAKQLGAGLEAQTATQLGALTLLSMYQPKAAQKAISQAYGEARAAIPEGTMVNTHNLLKELDQFENALKKGTTTPSKNAVLSQLEQVKNKASGGAMELEELVESFHNINENLSAKKLWDELGTSQKKLTKQRFDVLRNSVRKTVNENPVPGFTEKWNLANEAYAAREKSRRLSGWLEGHIGKIPPKLVGSIGFELVMGHPTAAAYTAGAAGIVKITEALEQISRSKLLQQHYAKALKAAASENLPATVSSIKLLNKDLEKQNKK